MTRVVIVCYYIHPSKSVAALRTTHLVDFLLRRGVAVSVVKPPDSVYGTQSAAAPSGKTYREHVVAVPIVKQRYLRLIAELLSWIVAVRRETEFFRPDSILFSGGPFYYFLSLFFLGNREVQRILDFRDPWVMPGVDARSYRGVTGRLKRNILIGAQLLFLRSADKVVNVLPEITAEYRRIYPMVKEHKFVTVMNGFDTRVMAESHATDPIPGDARIRLCIPGKFRYYNERQAVELVLALSDPDISGCFVLIQIGEDESFECLFPESGAATNYRYLGIRTYAETIAICKGVDVLLVNTRSRFGIGTKVFDYIALNKPVIAFVGEDYAIHHLLSRFPNYYRVEDLSGLKRVLSELSRNLPECLHHLTPGEVDAYSRDAQAHKLLGMLRPRRRTPNER